MLIDQGTLCVSNPMMSGISQYELEPSVTGSEPSSFPNRSYRKYGYNVSIRWFTSLYLITWTDSAGNCSRKFGSNTQLNGGPTSSPPSPEYWTPPSSSLPVPRELG